MIKSASAHQRKIIDNRRVLKIAIDQIDVVILKSLLANGRKSFSKIAKEEDISQDIIWQHYNKMKNDEIIVGSTIQLDYDTLGYKTVGSLQVIVSSDKQNGVITGIKKIPNVYGVTKDSNTSKIRVVFTLKDLQELERVIHKVKQIPGVLSISSEIWIGIRNILHNLSVLSLEGEKAKIILEKTPANSVLKNKKEIDLMDKQIIEKLDKNGRLSSRKIAQELDVSTDTISRRIKILSETGVIKPIIQIDPSKLGYVACVILNLSFISEDELSTIVDEISQIPDITLILKTSGIYDLCVIGLLKNIEQLFSIQDEIGKIYGITEMKTTITKLFPKKPNHSEYISTF